MSRSLARETAFKMLFQMDVGKNDEVGTAVTLGKSRLSGAHRAFAEELCNGVSEQIFELNTYLGKLTHLWEPERLAAVDRNIIRLGMFELQTVGTPAPVAINEAVELARKYGAAEAPAFVNAVLDNFYHKVVVEKCEDFAIDESMKEKYLQAQAEAERRAEELAAQLAAEAEAQAAAPVVAPKPDKTGENKKIREQGYRIIKGDSITDDEKIKSESVLEDKKRMYGEAAFLTPRDIKRAIEAGEELPPEVFAREEKPEEDRKFRDRPETDRKFRDKPATERKFRDKPERR